MSFDQNRFELACEAVAVHRAAMTNDESASLDVVLRGQVARDPSFGHDPQAVREFADNQLPIIRQLLQPGGGEELATIVARPEPVVGGACSELRRISNWQEE